MPVLESVLSDGNKDRQTDNLIKAFTKMSVLRIPVTACPIYENPFHWVDAGNILPYNQIIDATLSADQLEYGVSAFVSANGFSDLSYLKDGTYGIGFYTIENKILGIKRPINFINHNIINFCINYEVSIEYDKYIVYPEYSIEKGQAYQIIESLDELKNKTCGFQGTENMTPEQIAAIRSICQLVSGNSVIDMGRVPEEFTNLPGFDPDTFYILPPGIRPIEYIELLVSAMPPLKQIFQPKQIWNCETGQNQDSTFFDFSDHPVTNETMQYYGCQISEVTGDAMPGGGKGLIGHINDLLQALPAILSALSARNGLLDYLAALGGICAAFAQAIGTLLGVISGIMAAIQEVINSILGLIDTIINSVAEVIGAIVNQIAGLVGQLMALAQQVMSKILDEIQKIVQFFLDIIDQALAAIFGELDDCLRALIEQVAVPAAVGAVVKNDSIRKLGIF